MILPILTPKEIYLAALDDENAQVRLEGAKALFPVSRTYWERIEPVAESFGDLDPKMDGRELCQLLKSQEKTAHIRVVLLMRANDEEPRGELPPDEILRKPVPVETLKATLANLLSRV